MSSAGWTGATLDLRWRGEVDMRCLTAFLHSLTSSGVRPTPVPVPVPEGAGARLGAIPSPVLSPSLADVGLDPGPGPEPEPELGLAPGRRVALLGGARAVVLISSGIS